MEEYTKSTEMYTLKCASYVVGSLPHKKKKNTKNYLKKKKKDVIIFKNQILHTKYQMPRQERSQHSTKGEKMLAVT